jgi:hypothetical protein
LAPDLLENIDRRARQLGISRNRYIARALERTIAGESEWSPGLLETLEGARKDKDLHKTVDEMMIAIRAGRSHKKPRVL